VIRLPQPLLRVITKTSFTVVVVTLSSLGVFFPSAVSAQHGPGRHRPDSAPPYDSKSEATFEGTVTEVKTGRSLFSRLFGIHTLGLGPKEVQAKQLLVRSESRMLQIHLGPTTFLTEKGLEIRKGDTLEVTGALVMIGDSQVVLAREVRKGDSAWTLRDEAGQPLWSTAQTEGRGFWTKKKVLIGAVAIKVALLATVLRH
jgi:hypothetical protein